MRPRVLLVDVGSDLRVRVRHALEGAGYAVIEAAAADRAYDMARGGRADLVLLDLPPNDGGSLELARRLRALPDGPLRPIIGMTARPPGDAAVPPGLFNHVCQKDDAAAGILDVVTAYLPRGRRR